MNNINKLDEIEIYKLVLNKTLPKFPSKFWSCSESDSYAPKITRFLIEDILIWNNEDVKNKLRKKTFSENKLRGMLAIKYNNSPYKAITLAYPERKYKPWDFVNTPNKYWLGEKGKQNAINAVRWLIEEKLNWSIEDIKDKLDYQVFIDHNLLGMLRNTFNADLFQTIDSVYPGVFKKWEIGTHVKNNYWTEEEGILATTWLIEEQLKWNDDEIRKYYNKQIFIENNLNGMLQICFNSSPFKALNKVYPGKFKEWELSNVPKNFWNKETCYKAIRWLIDEDLMISNEKDLSEHLSIELLIEKGLCIPLEKYGLKGLINLYKKHK